MKLTLALLCWLLAVPVAARADALGRQLRVGPDESLVFSKRKNRDPLRVSAVVVMRYSHCLSVLVDWGDGTPVEEAFPFGKKETCALEPGPFEVDHLYAKPGKYRVRWYDNDEDPYRAAKAGPVYLEREIVVGK